MEELIPVLKPVRFLQKRSEDSEDTTCGGIEMEQNDNCRDTVLWAAGGGK